jgi:anti-anti-sigma regulatory factor
MLSDKDVLSYYENHHSNGLCCDMSLYDHLTELVLFCNEKGLVLYANPAARHYGIAPEKLFPSLFVPDTVQKGLDFFEFARLASAQEPTPPWELALGDSSNYTLAEFRGYNNGRCIVLLGQTEAAHIGEMHQEMQELTSELAEAQRQMQRQNRALQRALDEQRRLVETIQELSAPIAPLFNDVLLLPLIGHIDSHRANRITQEILQRVQGSRARYVILDITGIVTVDTAIARHLLDTAHAIHLLGAKALLVGINPSIAETVVHLGVNLHDFTIHSDLQHAIEHVLHQRQRRY